MNVETALSKLRESAPEAILPNVLVKCGIADGFLTVPSPIGALFVAASSEGVTCVTTAGHVEEFEKEYRARFGRSLVAGGRLRDLDVLSGGLSERVRGLRFDLRSCSDFEQAVLRKAVEIPSGEVRPYSWIAREIGRPKAVRAVGTALGHNPIPLLIPCHRVVRADGMLGQYSLGGPGNKRALLRAEGADPEVLEAQAQRGIRYVGSDTTEIFCYPTCRNARRITPPHRVEIRSSDDAAARGFRPCRVCRPAGAA